MIQLSNGHRFEYMAASGALGYYGKGWFHERLLCWMSQGRLLDPSLFTVVAKTVTYKKRKGNPPWYWLRFLKGGTVNAVGLRNPGYAWWQRGRRNGRGVGISLVASIFSDALDAPRELAYMARLFDDLDIVAIEINASCPNTPGDILKNTRKIIESCQQVKNVSRHPSILKLSVVHNIDMVLPEIKGIIEAISINSVPWRVIFPNRKSPFEPFGGGGVSGKIAQPYTWNFVKRLVSSTDIPVIGPSVWDFEDIAKLRQIGAKAISFGSIFLRYPWRPTFYVKKDIKINRI